MRRGRADRLRRARLALVAACFLAAGVLGLELPLGELFHQRSELSGVGAELAATRANEQTLAADVSSLSKPAAVATIAHQDYGLVEPGQEAYVVLPASGSAGSVASAPVPSGDLVPPVVSPYAIGDSSSGSKASPAGGPGLWGQVTDRLEFWRWSF